ncbi:MAG: hypothetical protein NDI62_00135 [Burkholderiales bacterium]|nr:hypothetical protein [Burkholderiales bacterium]
MVKRIRKNNELKYMEDFLIEARKLAYKETEKNYTPPIPILNLSTEKGKEIAKKLGANIDVVESGTLLMDCALGRALKEGRRGEHVQMSLDLANELLEKYSFDEKIKENIRHCILEHHGVDKFYSLESEICCNADCYRFISLKGFIMQSKYGRDMSFEEMVNLFTEKVEEKWNALSLDIVKKELTSQYEVILKILEELKK